MPINPKSRFRSGLWARRFKNYLQCALMLFVGYQLAWHKDSLGGHPGRALLVVVALATAYGTSVVHGVKWSSLWVVFAVVVLLVVSEIAIRDQVLKSIKK